MLSHATGKCTQQIPLVRSAIVSDENRPYKWDYLISGTFSNVMSILYLDKLTLHPE